MRMRRLLSIGTIVGLLLSLAPVASIGAQAAGPTSVVREISRGGISTIGTGNGGATGADTIQTPEIAPDFGPEGNSATAAPQSGSKVKQSSGSIINRSFSRRNAAYAANRPQSGGLTTPVVRASRIANSNTNLVTSFNGLNHRDQRLANGGNQFSLEPPDQGLCAGNGYVLETVNDVLRVFDSTGNALTGPIDLNSFYGYPPAINRTTGVSGPFMTDPSCYFDQDTQRWFHVDLTLDVDPTTGNFLGTNHLDIAVSTSASPLGSWVIYSLPAQDDGTDGTPDHHCSLNSDGSGHGPCLGDYPHIGADRYGFYITTNEYSFFGPEFKSAQVYALSKARLAANANTVTVVQFDTTGAVNSRTGTQPGFTVWPAEAPAGRNSYQNNGTEFFLSSNAGEEANGVPGGSYSNELIVWALTNSRSLNSNHPNPRLSNDVTRSEVYGIPPQSEQKAGDIPLGQCINDTSSMFGPGLGCWALFFGTEPAHDEVESHIDSNDTRMQQVWYANGRLWGALDTIVNVGGQDKAGIAYFSVLAYANDHDVHGYVLNQGYVAANNNNLTYPAVAVLPNGQGVMAFTLVGSDYYPSAAYTSIDNHGTDAIHVAATGLGPDDGFTSYKAFVGNPPRTRWGDYGAAVTDGNKIWIASEYIAQTCTLTQYLTGAIGSCGGTRTALANWGTRISLVNP